LRAQDVAMDVFDTLLGFAVILMVPGYFVLQPLTLLRFKGGWRTAAMVPLVGAAPTIVWSLYALSQDSNLWPLTFIFFAPIGSLYLIALMVVRYFRVGETGL
jgi:hypothetical protein